MSWVRSDLVECYWGRATVGLCWRGDEMAWTAVADPQGGLDAVRAFLAERGGWRRSVRVWLSAAHAKPFMVPASGGARNRGEALALARAMAAEFTGLTGDVAIWLDRWREDAACTAVAVDATLLESIRALCKELGWRCASVRPWWCLPLAEVEALARDPDAAVCWSIAEPDGMTMGTMAAGAVGSMDWVGVLDHDPSWTNTVRRSAIAAGAGALQWHARATLGQAEPGTAIGAWTRVDLT